MAGRGPAPKDPATRVRRNKTPTTSTSSSDGRLRGPALPPLLGEPWHPATVKWWANWRKSPQAKTWIDTDWDYLLDTALMHHTMWANGRWDFASEVRLRVAKFGATPADRLSLHLTIEQPKSDSARPASDGVVTDISSRRKRLTG
jgi:hypothetical protein